MANGLTLEELTTAVEFKLGQELAVPIPEPGTAAILGLDLLVLVARSRRA